MHQSLELVNLTELTILPLHDVAPRPNKEWKPKSSVIGSTVPEARGRSVSPPTDNHKDLKTEAAQLQDKLSQVNVSENQNVIIAAHIRVSETERSRLTFGSLGTEFEPSWTSEFQEAEESFTDRSARSVSSMILFTLCMRLL